MHPFVGDVLWGLSESLGTALCFETTTELVRVGSREDLARIVELAMRERDYRFTMRSVDAVRSVVFDDDVNWLVILMPGEL